ncbi:Set-Binding Protein [Manis pentadactyla]|nr:Set-Binding Protein [Manis pentadactyla]
MFDRIMQKSSVQHLRHGHTCLIKRYHNAVKVFYSQKDGSNKMIKILRGAIKKGNNPRQACGCPNNPVQWTLPWVQPKSGSCPLEIDNFHFLTLVTLAICDSQVWEEMDVEEYPQELCEKKVKTIESKH